MTIREQLEKALEKAFIGKYFTSEKVLRLEGDVFEKMEFTVGQIKFYPGSLMLIESPLSTNYTWISYGVAIDLVDKHIPFEKEEDDMIIKYTLK